ncbi:MAG: hypothetical protein AB7Q81_23715 [Gammaproteobacteria bacterium]
MSRPVLHSALAALALVLGVVDASPAMVVTVGGYHDWTLVEDPPHPGMSANVDSALQVSLGANGAVPAGVDIGYQSVDGATVGASTGGWYFSPSSDFSLAVDYAVSGSNPLGITAIGFGFGEDGDGANSGGAVLTFNNGSALGFGGAARTNDVSTLAPILGAALASSGRLFVGYEAASGNVSYGYSATPGSFAPDVSGTFSGLQNGWTDSDLLVSLFLRSDALPPFFGPLQAGSFGVTFGPVEVLAGTPAAVPLPAAAWLLFPVLAGLARRRRRAA